MHCVVLRLGSSTRSMCSNKKHCRYILIKEMYIYTAISSILVFLQQVGICSHTHTNLGARVYSHAHNIYIQAHTNTYFTQYFPATYIINPLTFSLFCPLFYVWIYLYIHLSLTYTQTRHIGYIFHIFESFPSSTRW